MNNNTSFSYDSTLRRIEEIVKQLEEDNKGIDELSALVKEASGHYQAWAKMFFNRVDQGEPIKESYPYPIQAWKVGNQLIISLGGEPVIDYAVQIKNIYGSGTFVFGYSNDVMAYIPSARVLAEGGYEGATSQMAVGLPATWKPVIEGLIHKEISRLVSKIENQP